MTARVLVTGAAGRIGSGFAAYAADRYRLVLSDRPGADTSGIESYGHVVRADLGDPAALAALCRDVDAVVHLAGEPSPFADWSSLLANNIIGAYHMFTAAADAGCRRFVFASSVHAVFGYPDDRQIRESDPVHPSTLYGVTKCFGEALARYMAEQRGMSVVAVRIGALREPDAARTEQRERIDHIYVSPRDLYQLLVRAIEFDGAGFTLVNGTSANSVQRLDPTNARELLGYRPVDGFVHGMLHDH